MAILLSTPNRSLVRYNKQNSNILNQYVSQVGFIFELESSL